MSALVIMRVCINKYSEYRFSHVSELLWHTSLPVSQMYWLSVVNHVKFSSSDLVVFQSARLGSLITPDHRSVAHHSCLTFFHILNKNKSSINVAVTLNSFMFCYNNEVCLTTKTFALVLVISGVETSLVIEGGWKLFHIIYIFQCAIYSLS